MRCLRTNCSYLICPGHPAYDGLKDGRNDIICVCFQCYSMCVKPNFLTGEEPCFKFTSKSCCCTSRCAMPKDEDAPGRMSLCCIGCPCLYLSCFGGELVLTGVYRGANLYIQNPHDGNNNYCITAIYINNQKLDQVPSSTAFNLDLSYLISTLHL